MSIYKISNDTQYGCLTANWDTNHTKSSININISKPFVATIFGFEGYNNTPILFSNDRITQNSKIITSSHNLSNQINENDNTDINTNITYISNNIIAKALPEQGFNN